MAVSPPGLHSLLLHSFQKNMGVMLEMLPQGFVGYILSRSIYTVRAAPRYRQLSDESERTLLSNISACYL